MALLIIRILPFNEAEVVQDHGSINHDALFPVCDLQSPDEKSPSILPPSKGLLHIRPGRLEAKVEQVLPVRDGIGEQGHKKVLKYKATVPNDQSQGPQPPF